MSVHGSGALQHDTRWSFDPSCKALMKELTNHDDFMRLSSRWHAGVTVPGAGLWDYVAVQEVRTHREGSILTLLDQERHHDRSHFPHP
jgi:hypothetical protein